MADNNNFFKIKTFEIKNTGKDHFLVSFVYECSKFGAFEEVVKFPTPYNNQALDNHLNLLSWVLGLSYYKLCAHKTISGPLYSSQPDATKTLISKLYQDGMAEFFIRNNLEYPYPLEITFKDIEHNITTSSGQSFEKDKALCAYGGGKDTLVALSLLKSQNIDATPVTVHISDVTKNTLEQSWDNVGALFDNKNALQFIKRTIDPKLNELSKTNDVFNGHIPITAINSLLLIVFAQIIGVPYVVFANEDSASEATLKIGNIEANHQYSKSFEVEGLLQDYLKNLSFQTPYYFSIIRPYSELRVAYLFSKLSAFHGAVTSCNRNFSSTNPLPKSEKWCRECPKCAFSYLILSPFLSEKEMISIFGENLIEKESLTPILKDLLGLSDIKPWECVGTIKECRAAFYQYLKSKTAHPDHIQSLYDEILTRDKQDDLNKDFSDTLSFRGSDLFPNDLDFYQ